MTDPRKLVLIAQNVANDLIQMGSNHQLTPEETMMVTTMTYQILRDNFPTPESLVSVMQEAEATLAAVTGEVRS